MKTNPRAIGSRPSVETQLGIGNAKHEDIILREAPQSETNVVFFGSL